MQARIAPSVQIEAQIEHLLLDGLEDGADVDSLERLSKLGRLGAQLMFQRAIEEEVERFLQRARFERTPTARGSRNGHRPRQLSETGSTSTRVSASTSPQPRHLG